MTQRSLAVASALLLLLGACSNRQEPTQPGALPGGEETTTGADKPMAGDKKGEGTGTKKGSQGGGAPSKIGSNKQIGGGGDGGGDKQSGGGSFAALWPAAGDYVYDQSGFEEFCQATCDKKDLPARQPISFSIKDRSENKAVVVSEARSSKSRKVRTTTTFTPEHALITEVHTSFKYETFEFNDTYHPDPPVETLRFPLKTGMSWSGQWKDKTSGEYAIAVTARETVSVGGEPVEAFRLQTRTTFKGQFEGRSDVTVWFDPELRVVVKTDGMVDVKSSFGRYRSEFATQLRSGPGY